MPSFLMACSSIPLQSKRLDSAEDHIIQAEQALAGSSSNVQIRIADENLGTASAYLDTLKDQKKFMTEPETQRYQSLKQRAEMLLKQIR